MATQVDPYVAAFAQQQGLEKQAGLQRRMQGALTGLEGFVNSMNASGLPPQEFIMRSGTVLPNLLAASGLSNEDASAFAQAMVDQRMTMPQIGQAIQASAAQAGFKNEGFGDGTYENFKVGNFGGDPGPLEQITGYDQYGGKRKMNEAEIAQLKASLESKGYEQAVVDQIIQLMLNPIMAKGGEVTQSMEQYEKETGDYHYPTLVNGQPVEIGTKELVLNKEVVKRFPELAKLNEMYPNTDAEGLPDMVAGGQQLADGGMARLVADLGQEFAGNETIGYGKGMARALMGMQNDVAVPAAARQAADRMIDEAYAAGKRLRSVDIQEIARRTGLNPDLVSKRAADAATTMSQGLFSRIKQSTGLADNQIIKHLPDLIERVGGVTRRTLANPKVAKSLGAVAGLAIPAAKAMAAVPGGIDDFLIGTPAGAPGGLSSGELPEEMTRFNVGDKYGEMPFVPDPRAQFADGGLIPSLQDGGTGMERQGPDPQIAQQAMRLADGVMQGQYRIEQIDPAMQEMVAAIIQAKSPQPTMPQVPGVTQNMAHSPIASGYEGSTTPVPLGGGQPTAPVNIPQVPGVTQNMAYSPIPQGQPAEAGLPIDSGNDPRVNHGIEQGANTPQTLGSWLATDNRDPANPNFRMGVTPPDTPQDPTQVTRNFGIIPTGAGTQGTTDQKVGPEPEDDENIPIPTTPEEIVKVPEPDMMVDIWDRRGVVPYIDKVMTGMMTNSPVASMLMGLPVGDMREALGIGMQAGVLDADSIKKLAEAAKTLQEIYNIPNEEARDTATANSSIRYNDVLGKVAYANALLNAEKFGFDQMKFQAEVDLGSFQRAFDYTLSINDQINKLIADGDVEAANDLVGPEDQYVSMFGATVAPQVLYYPVTGTKVRYEEGPISQGDWNSKSRNEKKKYAPRVIPPFSNVLESPEYDMNQVNAVFATLDSQGIGTTE
jgi:hypothetical protein